MKTTRCFAVSGMLVAAAVLWLQASQAEDAPAKKMNIADVERLVTELSNWGRWGKDDQLGAINLITPQKRKQAAKLVKDGISVSMARKAEVDKAVDNQQPFVHTMLSIGDGVGNRWAMDNFSVSYHGYAHTHMDSLCHLLYRGQMYNGFSVKEITKQGARKLSIHNLKNGILSRGILMDIPRLKGVKYLKPGTAIYPADLTAWEKKAGIRVGSGDVVFIRTGRWARRDELGPWDMNKEGLAGLHASCAKWLRERDVAMLGSDAASDVIPSGIPEMSHPVHLLTLHAMGVHIFDNCDLEAVSKTAAELGRWEFMITASPIPVHGGTGSPLNPIATF